MHSKCFDWQYGRRCVKTVVRAPSLNVSSLAGVRPCCPGSRTKVDEAAVEETMPVSRETSLSETILPWKDWPGVMEGSIEDGAAKSCRI